MLVFSTHAFTEGDVLSSFFGWLYAISTHAFTEGDAQGRWYMRPGQYFISTHAFTEGDGIACINANRLKYFNSRLHGRRQFFSHIRHSASLFQLTPSRKATRSRATTMSKSEISTHAFTECDLLSWGQYFFLFGFQLTPSRKATANSNNFCC